MSQIREIKDRMNGIQSTMKITKAMYMISSTKMNTAKQKAANTDPYFYSLRKQILTILQNLPDHFEHPYLDSREYIDEKHQNKAIICVTGDLVVSEKTPKVNDKQINSKVEYSYRIIGANNKKAHGVWKAYKNGRVVANYKDSSKPGSIGFNFYNTNKGKNGKK